MPGRLRVSGRNVAPSARWLSEHKLWGRTGVGGAGHRHVSGWSPVRSGGWPSITLGVHSLAIDELDVKRLRVGELVITDAIVTPSNQPLEALTK